MRILCIESDHHKYTQVLSSLKNRPIILDTAPTTQDAIDLARTYDYDLILLTPLKDETSCLQTIKKIRQASLNVPLFVLTPTQSLEEKLICFEAGADDCLVYPFDSRELIARMYAIVRRFKGHSDSVVKIGELEINFSKKNITLKGQPLPLTAKEYALVELLALRKGSILNKEQFLNHLYAGIDEPDIAIIDVFLFNIRQKMKKISKDKKYIHTVWGRGYTLKEDPSCA